MMPARRPVARAVGVGTCVTLGLAAVLAWPAIGRGQLLYRDFVGVPDPSLTARSLGLRGTAPRAVPLDLVVALLDPVVPSGAFQQLLLVLSLVMAGLGVTVLLRQYGPAATAVGAALATWSPYAVERLLLGQPPTLLAISSLPWIVAVAREVPGRRRYLTATLVAALPAALTPVGGVTAVLATVTAALVFRRVAARDLVGLAALSALWCAPWLVAVALGHADAGQASGAQAFAVRADGVVGVLDVFGGGGVWSEAASPVSRSGWLAVGASLLLLLLAVVGAAGLTGRRPRLLAVSCLVGPALGALLLATPTGLRVLGGAQSVPGVALLRDTHRWLGLGSVTTAVLAPMGLLRLLGMVPRLPLRLPDPPTAATAMRASRPAQVSRGKADWLRSAAAVATVITAVSLALLSAPDAALRLHAAYRPTALPPSWSKVVEVVGERHALLLPWQPLRAVAWAGAGPFLDPLPLALHGEVTRAQDLVVERAGRILRVGAGDPPESAAWQRGDLDPAVLRRLGIDVVVEWLGTPGRLPASHPGLTPVLSTDDFVVWSTLQ